MRIAHTADSHLGHKQYGFADRQDDYLAAVRHVFERSRELGADFMTLGGDQFQTAHPPASAVFGLYELVRDSVQHDIPVYGIDGNHDATGTQWLGVCGVQPLEIWDNNVPQVQQLVKDDEIINIFGLNSSPGSIFRKRLQDLVRGCKATDTVLDILFIHMPLADMWGMGLADVSAMEIATAVREIGTRLVLMGDIHDYKETVIGGVRFIYPGSSEMTASDEQPTKSFSVVDITRTELKTAVETIPTRPIVDVCIDTEKALDALLIDVQNATSAGRKPIVMVSYNPDIRGFATRAASLLKDRALYKLVPRTRQPDGDLFQQIADQTFERKGALRNLRDVLVQSFGDASDEYTLILQLLEDPDSVNDTIVKYAQAKGLDTIT
jgi:DNA repair exonuclease SbcCD nuclease subunit